MTDPILKKATELTKHTKSRYQPITGRIAYVVSHGQSYASNGYAIRTHGIAKALNGHGLETLCFVRPGRPWDMGIAKNTVTPEMQVDGVRYIHSRWPGDKKPATEEQKFTATITRLVELFIVYRPQVVIAASNHEIALPALVAARQLGLPFQYEVRGFWEVSRASRDPAWENSPEYQEHYNRECWVISRADQLYTLNSQMKEELVARGAKPEQIDLVPNSVSGMPRIVKQSNVRQQYGIPNDAYVLGYMGAITEYEGLDHLLEALKLLKKEKVYALIVGGYSPVNRLGRAKPEPIVQKLQKLAKSYGIHKQVIFTGRVDYDKLPEYFAAVDATVIPRVPLPVCELVSAIKPLEYLSYGKPLIASNVAPQVEVLEQGKLGWLYEKGDSGSLSKIIQTLRVTPDNDIELKTKAALDVVRKKYYWQQSVEPIAKKACRKSEASLLVKGDLCCRRSEPAVELNDTLDWKECRVEQNEKIVVSGELVGKGVSGRAAVLLIQVEDVDKNLLDLSLYGYLWSEQFQQWFKYLYLNEYSQKIFEFRSDWDGLTVRYDILKFGGSPNSKVTLKDCKVEIVSNESIEESLENYLAANNQLESVENLLYADITLNVIDGSSIWLSSMAKILSSIGDTLLLLKEDVENTQIYDSIKTIPNLTILQPSDFADDSDVRLDVKQAVNCLRILDNYLPIVKNVVVRGLDAALELHATRQFKYRSYIYLTDFYSYNDRKLVVSECQRVAVKQLARQARHFLVQTNEIKKKIFELSGINVDCTLIPPPLPEIDCAQPKLLSKGGVDIVYAGKVNPDWGVLELLDWSERLIEEGVNIRITVIANKISAPGSSGKSFRALISKRFKDLNVNHIAGLPRSEVIKHLSSADYIWCYRPKDLEESVLELSTKLLEAVASGGRAINYPSKIHENLLGKDYPFFVSCFDDFKNLVNGHECSNFNGLELAKKVVENHSIESVVHKLKQVLNIDKTMLGKVVFSGHDRKFIDGYYSYLKAKGAEVRFDEWEWGAPKNIRRSTLFLSWCDRVFCEWGLSNAVWYSKNNTSKKPLFVRLHLQEINERARKFGLRIEQENVTRYIVVSERVRKEAETLFGWEDDKSIHISNFVFDDEFLAAGREEKNLKGKVALGMVGVTPKRKRFDRAIDLLLKLREGGYDATLKVKGPRPEEYDFMQSGSRTSELEYYEACYKKIENNALLQDRVEFAPWGNDMPLWYENVDYILSPSDFESFHYAVADGVLSGCVPLIWPWEEASNIYPAEWVVKDVLEAFGKIDDLEGKKMNMTNYVADNRELVVSRYGFRHVFSKLDSVLFHV